VAKEIEKAVPGVVAQLLAKFVPYAGPVKALVDGGTWLVDNAQQLAGAAQVFLDSLQQLADGDASAFQQKLYAAMTKPETVSSVLSLAASQLGLGGLPQALRRAVSFVPQKVDEALRAVVSKAAQAVRGSLTAALGGGTKGGLLDGAMTELVKFGYQEQQYALWVAQTPDGPKVKVAVQEGNGYRFLTVLEAGSFSNAAGVQDRIKAQINTAKALDALSRPNPNAKPNQKTALAIKQKQAEVLTAARLVAQDIQANACMVLNTGCFAAEVKLHTRDGFRAVAEIEPGEFVLSRHEDDPQGERQWKVVEAKFVRTGRILHLHVNGEVIRTTPEHPFWVYGKGWTAAGLLKPGDWLSTENGWAAVEEVYDTGLYETVYNVRVADCHTYFVGDDRWSFGLWAHNDYTVRHLPSGSDRNSVWHVGQWHVFAKDPAGGGARPDRAVMTPDGSALFRFKTKAAAEEFANNQRVQEQRSENPEDPEMRYEKAARGRTAGVIRYSEVVPLLNGTAGTEIDFETATTIYECGVTFQGKLDQLIKLCIIARLRGKKVVGITAEHTVLRRFETYQQNLASLTFSSTTVQYWLRQFVADPTPFSDDRPLSDFFSGFQYT